ncbi:hypothetical protein U14_00654 [Candidatus Moduliflexus flocculans]|uniref:Uncharacterized protein n=1 Tax=Candidatus Moduliflexus flocculans TaxID=1499966 RepID=A0A0S6VQD6_9BACT|nr:hypothetical protein U14_00654 [Candidatus Moduliflexus flocculans]
MPRTTLLLQRLDEIGRSLERSGHALALIGLGSVGAERDRLDEFSDLDFFAIVEEGWKQQYIDRLGWLSDVCPVAYCFKNTDDGYKLLYEDGVFCEFAVFELRELPAIAFARGRIVWKQPQISDDICVPTTSSVLPAPKSTAWRVGEALTNLYVGLGRFKRGEKLSASRFIQHYAVDRILELSEQLEQEQQAQQDPFANERRYEQRFPQTAQRLPEFVQGYERSRESALAILAFLEAHFEVNPAIAAAIRQLCA